MSGQPLPLPPGRNIALDTSLSSSSPSSSVWERFSLWASENKVLVYSIAGVAVVVTGAGIVYYRSDSSRGAKSGDAGTEGKRKSKKERRKEKKQADVANKEPQGREAAQPCRLMPSRSDAGTNWAKPTTPNRRVPQSRKSMTKSPRLRRGV